MKMLAGMQTKVPAINLYDERIRSFAKAFGPVVIRFSGVGQRVPIMILTDIQAEKRRRDSSLY